MRIKNFLRELIFGTLSFKVEFHKESEKMPEGIELGKLAEQLLPKQLEIEHYRRPLELHKRSLDSGSVVARTLESSTETDRNNRINDIRGKLDDLGYTPTGRQLGSGNWGVVDEYQDIGGNLFAIKILSPDDLALIQSRHWNLGLEEAIKRESVPLYSASFNVVPRVVTRHFVLMPVYTEGLDKKLEKGKRLDLESTLKISSDILSALSFFHTDLGRTHSDIKPDNIVMDRSGKANLNDFGAATYVLPEKQSTSPRDNPGTKYTRAPECFRENSHPDERSDVWSMGNLIGRLFTGYYLFESRIDKARSSEEAEKDMSGIGKSDIDKEVEKAIKKVPWPFREVIKKSLQYHPADRYANAQEMYEAFSKAMGKYEEIRSGSRFRKRFFGGLAAIALACAIPFGIHAYRTYQDNTNLQKEVQKVQESSSIQRKKDAIRAYIQSGGKVNGNMDTQAILDRQEIEGWIGTMIGNLRSMTKDHRFTQSDEAYKEYRDIGFAAYLNSDAVYAAIKNSEGKTDIDSLEPILEKIDRESFWDFRLLRKGIHDNWVYASPEHYYRKADGKWKEADRDYEYMVLLEGELAKAREKYEQAKNSMLMQERSSISMQYKNEVTKYEIELEPLRKRFGRSGLLSEEEVRRKLIEDKRIPVMVRYDEYFRRENGGEKK